MNWQQKMHHRAILEPLAVLVSPMHLILLKELWSSFRS